TSGRPDTDPSLCGEPPRAETNRTFFRPASLPVCGADGEDSRSVREGKDEICASAEISVCRGEGLFHGPRESRFHAGSGVLVDQVLGGGLIQLAGCDTKCLVGSRLVFGFDGGADLLHNRSQHRTMRAIVKPALLVLPQLFLGTWGIGHFRSLEILSVQAKIGVVVRFESGSIASSLRRFQLLGT